MPMAPIPQPDDNEKPTNHGDEVDAVDVPDQIIIADSSDSEIDDEDIGYGGYQMLQQSIGDSDDDDDEDASGNVDPAMSVEMSGVIVDADVERSTTADEASRLPSGLFVAEGTMPSYMKVPDFTRPSPGELLWNQQVNRDIQINEDQSEQIKKTMSAIKLPESNIPPWASDISEDEWKHKLQNLIGHNS